MRLLRRHRHRSRPRTRTIRPAEPYLARGAEEARRLGHNFVGTEHVLLVLIRDRDGGATMALQQLGVTAEAIEEALGPCIGGGGGGAPRIDPEALATLGIDFQAVRKRLEETFGPGALEQTRSACLSIAPRLKLAFAYALDYADGEPLRDEHILLGMLTVPDSLAAQVLGRQGVSLQAAQAVVADRGG
jgi:ATP-dependent Clp protease ATP-binding subunit ClpA